MKIRKKMNDELEKIVEIRENLEQIVEKLDGYKTQINFHNRVIKQLVTSSTIEVEAIKLLEKRICMLEGEKAEQESRDMYG